MPRPGTLREHVPFPLPQRHPARDLEAAPDSARDGRTMPDQVGFGSPSGRRTEMYSWHYRAVTPMWVTGASVARGFSSLRGGGREFPAAPCPELMPLERRC